MTSSSTDISTITETEDCKNMMPNIFMQSYPITNLDDMKQVICEPPQWVNRVLPLAHRRGTVLQNSISDCHSDAKHFLVRDRFDYITTPKTLVCHDYRGGYLADKYIHEADEDIVGNGYTFYNWAQIDIFVYFSHHFITIPPLSWINAGHRQGVKVLGTLITEFENGAQICDEQIFSSLSKMHSFASSLADITKIFGFDGWLLNIENEVKNVDILKEFVPYFTNLIHRGSSEHIVIWYDSVTEEGKLRWQNELNDKNRYFFDHCDGIFLNYTWTEQHLINSVEEAEHRRFDVFVGIDIFGRNTYGGGKFNTFKAAEVVRRHNLSMALFATGWTYETLETSEDTFEAFLNRDSAFWLSIWPYLFTHPMCDDFTTNFYIGLDQKCYNLFSQDTQLSKFLHPMRFTDIPELTCIPTLTGICNCMQNTILGNRNGCLLSKNCLRNDIEYVHHLFACDMDIIDNTVVYFLTKSSNPTTSLSVTLIINRYNKFSFKKIKLLGETKTELKITDTLMEINPTEAPDIIKNIRNRYYKKIAEEQWKLSVFVLNTRPSTLLEIGGTIENGENIYLGVLGIEHVKGNFLKNI